MEGADPLDSQGPDDLARAAARQVFVKEDSELLPADALAKRMPAALAANDRVLEFRGDITRSS
jgi:hypothetical protein